MAENQTQEARKPFKVEITDHYDFNAIASGMFITSNEFCKMVADMMKSIFADFEGCTFDVQNGGGEPTIGLIFNHGDYTNSELPVCCERSGAKPVGSTIIDRGRSRDLYNRNGDRYFLTEDGQDFVKTLISRRFFNNGGNIDFKRVVSEFVDRGPANIAFNQQQVQFTKVCWIDIKRLCALLFGTDEENGDNVEYDFRLCAPIQSYGSVCNYVLKIDRISAKELTNFCTKIGVSMQSINIIR